MAVFVIRNGFNKKIPFEHFSPFVPNLMCSITFITSSCLSYNVYYQYSITKQQNEYKCFHVGIYLRVSFSNSIDFNFFLLYFRPHDTNLNLNQMERRGDFLQFTHELYVQVEVVGKGNIIENYFIIRNYVSSCFSSSCRSFLSIFRIETLENSYEDINIFQNDSNNRFLQWKRKPI